MLIHTAEYAYPEYAYPESLLGTKEMMCTLYGWVCFNQDKRPTYPPLASYLGLPCGLGMRLTPLHSSSEELLTLYHPCAGIFWDLDSTNIYE